MVKITKRSMMIYVAFAAKGQKIFDVALLVLTMLSSHFLMVMNDKLLLGPTVLAGKFIETKPFKAQTIEADFCIHQSGPCSNFSTLNVLNVSLFKDRFPVSIVMLSSTTTLSIQGAFRAEAFF